MSEKYEKLKLKLVGFLAIQALGLLFFHFVLHLNSLWVAGAYFIINAVALYYLWAIFQEEIKARAFGISRILGSEAKDAFIFGEIGIVTYDENYLITWMSELFEQRNINSISNKVTMWLPEVNALFQGDSESVIVKLDENYYEITRKEDAQILFFKDVTDIHNMTTLYNDEQVIIGLIHLDNYEETTQYEEEQVISSINSLIRQPVVDWAKNAGMYIKRLKADRFIVVLNEKIFKGIVDDRFSILNRTRKQAAENDVSITLSMAFARGTNNFDQLDDMANSLLELAQSRGGDQVAIKKFGEDVKYFGGSSEAQEKRSRVRVRVMAQTLRDLILQSTNVIIVGHNEMDFDCMGAAIGMSRIVSLYNKKVCIVSKTGGIEEKLNNALNLYKNDLVTRHNFVSEMEAINQYRDSSLVIMVDHHSAAQSNGSALLAKAKRVAILDHHRRSADLLLNPILVYIEAGASSVSELISELFPYQVGEVDLSATEATIMLTGIMIDTNRFRFRTGSRTFESASMLRKLGGDPGEADNLLKDDYENFEEKTSILKYCEKYDNGIVISSMKDNQVLHRSILSQAADYLLAIKEVEAAFVIALIEEGKVAISARSSGVINVQVIMEKMRGGGHLTAAALQRDGSDIAELEKELKEKITEYFNEEDQGHESNTVK